LNSAKGRKRNIHLIFKLSSSAQTKTSRSSGKRRGNGVIGVLSPVEPGFAAVGVVAMVDGKVVEG
jgi:hypothetical protein